MAGAGMGVVARGLAPAAGSTPVATGRAATCPKCGASVPTDFKFCGTCGQPMAAVQPGMPMAAPVAQAAPVKSGSRGNLVLIRPDGTEGESFALADSTTLGRSTGGLFASDAYLSPNHTTFAFKGEKLVAKDEGSLNGLYLRIERNAPTELKDGNIFRIGQEIIRFEAIGKPEARKPDPHNGVHVMGGPNPNYLGRVCLVIGRTTTGNCFCVPAAGLHMGRERGDIVFPEDGYVSGLHCRLHGENGRIYLTDLGSSNGTFIRVNGEAPLRSGSLLLMGQQLFRVEY